VKVTPLIGDDGSVQLEIDQKVDDKVGDVQVDANTQPIIGHRQPPRSSNVADGEMIVLGGLQQTKHSTTRNKTRLPLRDSHHQPILGGRTHEEDRTELLLFVRPLSSAQDTSKDANASINQLTNKDQVNEISRYPSRQEGESV